jgi:hypothetical protein
MDFEINSIQRNQTWDLVEVPIRKCAITTKWIFKIIFDSSRKVQKLSLRQDL